MNIMIIYEDEDLLVIDKPAGTTVNTAETTQHEQTIQDWAEDYLQIKGERKPLEPGNDFYNRGGIVHRLDKETSGVLVLAKNPESFAAMQKKFKDRTVEKGYVALAHGLVMPRIGEISVPVGRLPWNRKQFGIVPGGRDSLTSYNVMNYYQDNKGGQYSLLELSPKTGRTHQIRVHLKYIGYPIFADFLYAGRKTARKDRKVLNRVFLHAAKITFTHPKTGLRMELSSQLPDELSKVLGEIELISKPE